MAFKRNYDPETSPNAYHRRIGEVDISLIELSKIYENIEADQFALDEHDYDDGILISSKLHLSPQGSGADSIWKYSGTVNWDQDIVTPAGIVANFFSNLSDAVATTDHFDLEDFYYSNAHLLAANRSSALAVVICYPSLTKVNYSNYHDSKSTSHPLVGINLRAPTLKELDMRPGEQIISHLAGYAFCVNAIAKALDSNERIKKMVITPDGPLIQANAKNRRHGKSDRRTAEDAVVLGGHNQSQAARENEEKTMTLNDIGGLEDIRQKFKEVVLSFTHPEVMQKWGAERPQGIFLYGPSGTGKTTLSKALANEINAKFIEVKSSEINDKWYGNSEKNMQKLFDDLKNATGPVVLLFDEFESVISTAQDNGGGVRAQNAVAGIFKKEMESLREKCPNVIVVAATNHEDKVDESLMRAGRFDLKFYVPLPDEAARRQIFSNTIAKSFSVENTLEGTEPIFAAFDVDIDVVRLAELSDGMSGADIVEVVRRVKMGKAMDEARGIPVTAIGQNDLIAGIQDIKTE